MSWQQSRMQTPTKRTPTAGLSLSLVGFFVYSLLNTSASQASDESAILTTDEQNQAEQDEQLNQTIKHNEESTNLSSESFEHNTPSSAYHTEHVELNNLEDYQSTLHAHEVIQEAQVYRGSTHHSSHRNAQEEADTHRSEEAESSGMSNTTLAILGVVVLGGGAAAAAAGGKSGGGSGDGGGSSDGGGSGIAGFNDKDSTLHEVSGSDISMNQYYSKEDLAERYNNGHLHPLNNDLVTFTVILNRKEVTDSDYLSINDFLQKNYQDQQEYVEKHKEEIEGKGHWYGADPQQMNGVKEYLTSHNIQILHSSPEERSIHAQASNTDFNNAFHTTIYNGGFWHGPLQVANSDVANAIMGVVGILGEHFHNINTGSSPQEEHVISKSSDYTYPVADPIALHTPLKPVEAAAHYQPLTDSSYGHNVKIGLISPRQNTTDEFNNKLQTYVNSQYDEPSFELNLISKGEKTEITDIHGSSEFYLDTSIIASIAPKAHLYLLGNSEHVAKGDIYNIFAEGIYLSGPDELDIISSSYQQSHFANYQHEVFEALMQDAALRDITIIQASGDRGSGNNSTIEDLNGIAKPEVYTGAPSLLSVGATAFTENTPASSATDQTVWNHFPGQTLTPPDSIGPAVSSSGVFSTDIYPIPSYQDKLTFHSMNTNANTENTDGRAYPDISMLGNAVYEILDGGGAHFGGTSASAPLTAALIANIVSTLRAQHSEEDDYNLGFINPLFYEAYGSDNDHDVFYDVTDGNNATTFLVSESHSELSLEKETYYQATGGPDTVSGLGSINASKLYEYIHTNHGHEDDFS